MRAAKNSPSAEPASRPAPTMIVTPTAVIPIAINVDCSTRSRSSTQPIIAAKTGAAASRNRVVAADVRDSARMYSIEVTANTNAAAHVLQLTPAKLTGRPLRRTMISSTMTSAVESPRYVRN